MQIPKRVFGQSNIISISVTTVTADFGGPKLDTMVTEPIRYEYVFDIFLTNNSTLFKKKEIMPGLLDHEIVYTEVSIKPQIMP